MTIEVLAERGESKRGIARRLGVNEKAVRYHLKRRADGAIDGRANRQVPRASEHAERIAAWWSERANASRPPNVTELYDHLVAEHGYEGSYKSVLRFVRARYPRPRIRTYRRVETLPGAQTQTDWGEYPRIHVGGEEVSRSVFVMVLSHSRYPAVVWSTKKDQVSWLACHNDAYRRLNGVAAVNRIDNVKTAVVRGAGAWGEIHPSYQAYADVLGFHVEACAPRAANAKGKVESKVKLTRLLGDFTRLRFESDEHLQEHTDARLQRWAEGARCPATGRSVLESWEREVPHLRPLPILPEPFDVVVTRRVRRDCTVAFEGRTYSVPFSLVGQDVEVRGCAGRVQVLAGGRIVQEHPRGTRELLVLDPACYEGASTDRVLAPPPLGKVGRRLEEIARMPVEERPLDLYAALAEVAR